LILSKKITIKDTTDNIVAIIDTNGSVLSSDKQIKQLITYLTESSFIPKPFSDGSIIGVEYDKPENELELISLLEDKLPKLDLKL
jgi:DNA gyrase inhibitor GyrI